MTAWLRATLFALFVMTAGGALAQPAPAAPAAVVRTPQVTAELVPETAGVAPGGTVHVALRQTIKAGWHTYWRNPGDSGEATQLRWTLPPGWTAGEIVWPVPERQPIGPLVNYGYSKQVLLPVPVTAPADAKPGETVRLRADAFWLVCEEVCIPEQGALVLDLPVTAGAPGPFPRGGREVARTVAEAPKPGNLNAGASVQNGSLKLAFAGPALRGVEAAGAYFFPFEGTLIDHAKPQAVERGPEGLTLTLAPGYGLQAGGGLSAPVEGVLSVDGRAYQIAAAPGALPAGAAGLGAPPAQRSGGGGLSLPLAAGLALLGGLILNLMPCVFPVLGVKAAALAGHAHEPRAARAQGLAFGAGVMATFLLLAGLLLAARAAGEAAGWGFQLQSPPVVAALAVLTLLIGLNLSGVFHMGGSLQNLGGDLAVLRQAQDGRRGLAGSFFTGALAVVVAAPCTAPFMAGAIGWALLQPPAGALAVFAALAVGFALPFTALSFSPALLRRLPRPGAWMETLRNLLAFPMYAAAAWLIWVFARQAGIAGLGELAVVIWLAALAAWLWGRSQASARGLAYRVASVLAAVAVLGWFGMAAFSGADAAPTAERGASAASEAWSPERVAALQAEGRPVFVNFTADWCVTCKVNERVALSNSRVIQAFERSGAAYLKADWTARDALIAETLTKHGRSGVPLYLLYGKGGGEPQVLPQLLTPGAVVRALEAAGEDA